MEYDVQNNILFQLRVLKYLKHKLELLQIVLYTSILMLHTYFILLLINIKQKIELQISIIIL